MNPRNLKSPSVFKTDALNHSAILPRLTRYCLFPACHGNPIYTKNIGHRFTTTRIYNMSTKKRRFTTTCQNKNPTRDLNSHCQRRSTSTRNGTAHGILPDLNESGFKNWLMRICCKTSRGGLNGFLSATAPTEIFEFPLRVSSLSRLRTHGLRLPSLSRSLALTELSYHSSTSPSSTF